MEGILRGEVVEFDERRGTGTVVTDGGGTHPFHCTAVADGSRNVPVGVAVHFRLVAGHLGRWEATDLVPIPQAGLGP